MPECREFLDTALIARLANEFYSESQRGVQAPAVAAGVSTAFATAPVPTPTVPTAVAGLSGAAPGIPSGAGRAYRHTWTLQFPTCPVHRPCPASLVRRSRLQKLRLARPAIRSLTGGYPPTSPAAPVHPILGRRPQSLSNPSLSLNPVHMIRAAGIACAFGEPRCNGTVFGDSAVEDPASRKPSCTFTPRNRFPATK